MKISKLLIILIYLVLLAGCKQSSGSSSYTSGSLDSYVGSGSVSGAGSSGSSGSSGSPSHLVPNPEPATLALLGIGLAGLAVVTLRKKKK